MKRKLSALLLTLALALSPAVNAGALFTNAWRIDDAGMTVELPSGWEVLTRGMDADDVAYTTMEPEYYEETLGMFEYIDTLYMHAIDTESYNLLYIYVEDYGDDMDFRTVSDEYAEAMVERYREIELDSAFIGDVYVRDVNGLMYIWTELVPTQNDYYLLRAETCLNGVCYQIYVDCLDPIDDNVRNLMYGILKSTSYDAVKAPTEEPTPEPLPEPESADTAVPESETPRFDANAGIGLAAALLCAAGAVTVY